MELKELTNLYQQTGLVRQLAGLLSVAQAHVLFSGLTGAARTLMASAAGGIVGGAHMFILPDRETAAYFLNDLETIHGETELPLSKKKILYYPVSYKRNFNPGHPDNANLLQRTEVLNKVGQGKSHFIVTYPEALLEKVIARSELNRNTLTLKTGETVAMDFLNEILYEYHFDHTEYVTEPGQFSIRGGIVDIFSYANDLPYRIELFGDDVESIRTFDPSNQLSIEQLKQVRIVPNLQHEALLTKRTSFLAYVPGSTVIWTDDIRYVAGRMQEELEKNQDILQEKQAEQTAQQLFYSSAEWLSDIDAFKTVELANRSYFNTHQTLKAAVRPQPSFNKNFDLFYSELKNNTERGFKSILLTDNPGQVDRVLGIIHDLREAKDPDNQQAVALQGMHLPLHEGFIDLDHKIACYTDHQLFDRYQKFRLRDSFKSKETFTLKEIYNLQPGDYVTHIDYGIGQFDGLEIIDNNGKKQEAIRLLYKDSDILYVSIHSLHRISKYVGKEGHVPAVHRLGSNTWANLKQKTKKRIKDIAKELIKLYAERKTAKGFAFSADSYLQHELEASFLYEDTPDQEKSTRDVKQDMEAAYPMDRLICGDVGFGKTEIAVRAAFKAVADSKQVAVLVPTTILAFQHFQTFSSRLEGLPCRVDYINRFRSAKEQKQIREDLKAGKIDILIGTHRLVSKDIVFKDLGLLVIDEEQKFGVSMKEQLKQLKVNIDTLTLTATPIPRTLQFSLMGARDMSVLTTAPPNRQPIETELHVFDETLIREAILYEISRGGQVFVVNNRVQNIMEVSDMIRRLCPEVKVAIGHGQMEGHQLEKVMMDFMAGHYGVLVATTIIESGLDIPNVNTIIIIDANNYGLSDLHQLRGRAGRSNKKAFCYLIAPPVLSLTPDAKKRLKAIEEFSDLGSGFNIAMRDLDIRGAGNILGAEQSGFISEVGFEMYHKILDEAITELKETEFKGVFEAKPERDYIKECQIETDMEILIPTDYVAETVERLSLYKELDNIDDDVELNRFYDRLKDRFGPVPAQTAELIDTIRLRKMSKHMGFEKLILKKGRMIGHFVQNSDSGYYDSPAFGRLLEYIKRNPIGCRMKDKDGKLTFTVLDVDTIHTASGVMETILA